LRHVTSSNHLRPADARRRIARPDPHVSARRAGLRYTTDDRPGITRRRSGRGFSYRHPSGRIIRDRPTLARIHGLAVPPAWTDVWISVDVDGHLQATGRDARGRKQYRYHARWRARRDDAKFYRIVAFAALLPRIRRRCDRDLARHNLNREKVLAAVVRLLELSLIRVGNDEYARLNRSFGLATMKDRHASVEGSTIRFRFRGKSGRHHEVDIRDRRLATVVRRCQELPGQELFQYLDGDGQVHDVTSDDVNAYLREAAGGDVTTRDFRIWAGTVMAYRALCALDHDGAGRSPKQTVVEAIRISAGALGNTAAVARRSYVHPAIPQAYVDGLIELPRRRGAVGPAAVTPADADVSAELAVIELLQGPLDGDAARVTAIATRGVQAREPPG
jgi:DNA topoisomerase I